MASVYDMIDEVFLIGTTKYYQHYIVKGSNNNIYEVRYDIFKDSYLCNCPNIRLTNCKHIKKVKKDKRSKK